MNSAEATHHPRIHQGWGKQTLGMETGINPEVISLLEKKGQEVDLQQTMGSTQSITWRDGTFQGYADARRPNPPALGVDQPPPTTNEPPRETTMKTFLITMVLWTLILPTSSCLGDTGG